MIRIVTLQFILSRTMSTYTAFVYGTLKIGQPNHREMTNPLNGVAKYIGKGYTLDQFPLVIASEYNIPFLLYKKGTGKFILSRTMSTYNAFVYGTLKIGQPNHREMTNPLNGVAKYIGKGYTLDQFPLVIASEYNIPFLLYKKGTGKQIHGDIYEIDEKMLATLDDFEDHPKFYERDMVTVKMIEDNQQQKQDIEKQCWCYFLKKYKPNMLELPCYESYDSKGDHGLVYVESEELSDPECL